MAETPISSGDIEIYPPDDSSGQYGRDFYHPSIGFARIQLAGDILPAASVSFLDLQDVDLGFIRANSRVDLIDAITNERTVRGLAWAAIVMGAYKDHE
jgi:hypothetical protein